MSEKPTYEELEKRINELEKENFKFKWLGKNHENQNVTLTISSKDEEDIQFEDLFNIADIQLIQDEFSLATGVAAIMTRTDGTPITSPSNFCRLCKDIIRKTEKGLANCYKSDTQIGRFTPNGPIIQPCMSGGLWDAGAGITVGGRHIANWLIGQVRDESQTEANILAYAHKIGADKMLVLEAFREVPAMSREKFEQIAKVLFTIANQLSTTAYQNVQKERFIKEIKKTEAKLRESEEKYRHIFNSSSDSIFIHDLKTDKILDVNDPMLSLYGYQKKEVIGSVVDKFSSGIAPYDLKNAADKIKKAGEIGNHIFEWQARKKNGELFWTEVNLRVSKLGDEGLAIAVVRDISNRKRTQEILIQTEKMMSVGGLAAGMAHEINNPLAGMIQNADLMARRLLDTTLPANIKIAEELSLDLTTLKKYFEKRDIPKMFKAIKDTGGRISDIIENMLSFARKSDDQKSSHSVTELLDKTIELAGTDFSFKKHFDFKSIDILRKYEEDLPLFPCEAAKIQQVFLNILNNGAQAMHGAQIKKPKFTLKAWFDTSTKMICTQIEDNGPGIDEEIQKRIFEPFFTTKSVGEGTGLGLSVSYFIIIEDHQGKIEVESQVGKGTKFTIKLPTGQSC